MASQITLDDLKLEAARRFFYNPTGECFLDYVMVEEPPPGRGAIPFERWGHLNEFNEAILGNRLVELLKSRQIGASWNVAAYLLWKALFHQSAHCGQFSRNEDDAKELVRKQKFIYQRLPKELQVPVKSMDNQLEMVFPSTDSWIRAFPSTENAGRGYTFSVVWFDEFDFHPYAAQSYTSVKPALDDVGGQVIITSTSNYREMTSEFKTIYNGAPSNGFKALFFGWNVRANRDEDWYQERRMEYSDEYQFEKEYPATAEEALAPPKSLAAFDVESLQAMKFDCRLPISSNGIYSIYQKHVIGHRYAAATDVSHGVGLDESVTVIRDVNTGYIVADLVNSSMSPDELALNSVDLLAQYGNPIWGIEDNDWGVQVISKAEELGYPNLYRAEVKSSRGRRSSRGWHTDAVSRFHLWGDLQMAVRNRTLVVPNERGLGQFYSVIRNPDKNGRIEAISGSHDDYPMAVGITLQIAPWASRGSKYLTRQADENQGRPSRRRRLTPWRWSPKQ